MSLSAARCGGLFTYDGTSFRLVADRDVPQPFSDYRRKIDPSVRSKRIARILESKAPVHDLDVKATEGYLTGDPGDRAIVDLGGARTVINVPLLKEGSVRGFISLYRQEVRAF